MAARGSNLDIPHVGMHVYVRLRPDGIAVAYPGIVVSSVKNWRVHGEGFKPRPYRPEFHRVRVAVAVEVGPGQWIPAAPLVGDVGQPGCRRLRTAGWRDALTRGLPFFRAAIYSHRDVPVAHIHAARRRPASTSRPPARRGRVAHGAAW